MFEKILSVMPYNPGTLHQMAFYSQRMREEASIRRTGMVFLVLAFMVQFFVMLAPPQATVASSNNDLVSGGISGAADAKRQCLSNARNFGDIIHYYGITCKDLGEASTLTIHSKGQNYYSAGWIPQGARNNVTGEITDETPATIYRDGRSVGKIYWRKLASWDSYRGSGVAYQALRVRNSEGKVFYVLYRCGNLVSVGVPRPPKQDNTPPIEKPQPAPQPNPTPPTTPTSTPATPTPGGITTVSTPSSTPVCQFNPSLPAGSPQCYQPCEYNPSLPAGSPSCKPCDKSAGSADTLACVAVHKTASNLTSGLANADGTVANPGDVIVYTLYAENTGKKAVKDYVFQENLSDVLDYADATDFHGGSIDTTTKIVSWPAETIAAGATATHQITVKVKAVIPQTPPSASDPNHFDLIMTNVYGNAINIRLPGSPAQAVQTAAATLPNTGPGTTLFIAGMVVIMAGYFYSRSRLLATESDIAVKANAAV